MSAPVLYAFSGGAEVVFNPAPPYAQLEVRAAPAEGPVTGEHVRRALELLVHFMDRQPEVPHYFWHRAVERAAHLMAHLEDFQVDVLNAGEPLLLAQWPIEEV